MCGVSKIVNKCMLAIYRVLTSGGSFDTRVSVCAIDNG
jgi:hypothetical protein